MKKVIIYTKRLFIAICVILLIISFLYIYAKYIWRGEYASHWWTYMQINVAWNSVTTNSILPYSDMAVTFVQRESDDKKKEVYVWFYVKLFNLCSYIEPLWPLQLKENGTYKVYYKNPDNTLDYIKDITVH